MAPDPEGRVVVAGHGNAENMTSGGPTGPLLEPSDVASRINNVEGLRGRDVLLVSCNTGVTPNSGMASFAQRLANELRVTVHAPNNFVWAYPDGKIVVAPPTSPSNATWQTPVSEISRDPDMNRRGRFVPFGPQ